MSMMYEEQIRTNLECVESRVQRACERAGRAREDVTLVAVTKTRPMADIVTAYHCGVRHFGENRVEEALAKVPEAAALEAATWHMIGHLQSRKAADAVALFDMIHSVDSVHLAKRLDHSAEIVAKRVPILLEVNVSGEESKYGFSAVGDVAVRVLVEQVALLAPLAWLDVRGLMTMAPLVSDPEEARPVFRRLRLLRDMLRKQAPYLSWSQLSMGMTNDFEIAIEEGATLVRIGRAIFGPSTY